MTMFRNVILGLALLCGVGFVIELAVLAVNTPEPVGDAPRHAWTVAWLIWMTASIVGFALIEGAALFNDEGGDTLTEQIQWIAGKSPLFAGAVFVGIVSFFGWFLSHLFGRDSRVWKYLAKDAPEGDPPAEEVPDDRT